jgi:FkbM family methyltransferase
MSVVEPADKGRLRKPRKLLRLLRTPRYRQALRAHRVAAAIEHDEVAFGHSFRTVIDVGGHTGQFALFALERFPGARVVVVEPLEEGRRTIASVLDGGAEVLPYAAGAEAGTAQLHVSRASDSSSLLPITENYTDAFAGTDEVGTVGVEVRPLDEIVPAEGVERPALLKIDVQGGEGDVLRGAPRLLERIDEVYVECSFVEFYDGQVLADEVVELMRAAGLRLTGVYGVVHDRNGRTLQSDFLFSRDVVRAP